MFFEKEYVFKGKHARYVNELKEAIFNRNIDVLILAPIVGIIYNTTGNLDETNDTLTAKIFPEQMIKENEKILFNYRLCMLLSDDGNDNQKVDNAFKYYIETDDEYKDIVKKNIEKYNSYILGGVEILYDVMLKGNKEYNGKPDDPKYKRYVLDNVMEFIADYVDQVKDNNREEVI